MKWLVGVVNTAKNWLVKWGVKKWLVGVVNTALADSGTAEKMGKSRVFVDTAIAKVEAVITFLKSISAKLADNKVTDDEADAAVDEATALAASLCNRGAAA